MLPRPAGRKQAPMIASLEMLYRTPLESSSRRNHTNCWKPTYNCIRNGSQQNFVRSNFQLFNSEMFDLYAPNSVNSVINPAIVYFNVIHLKGWQERGRGRTTASKFGLLSNKSGLKGLRRMGLQIGSSDGSAFSTPRSPGWYVSGKTKSTSTKITSPRDPRASCMSRQEK